MKTNLRCLFMLITSVGITACSGAATPTRVPSPIPAPPQATATTSNTSVSITPDGGALITLAPGLTMEMVRVPAGAFLMGSGDTENDAQAIEKPQAAVTLDEYYIGKNDVTNAQYAIFVHATGRTWTMPTGKGLHPVVNVSWKDAVAFCEWLSQLTGRLMRLPTEAQWEKAARSADGRKYPWGNEQPDAKRVNFNNNVRDTTVIGQYSPQSDSPYGASDMAGNVRNWTSSLLRAYPYRTDDGRENQQVDEWRAVRGGGFITGSRGARSASRESYSPTGKYDSIGFRVVMIPG